MCAYVPSIDSCKRINYLYQIGNFMSQELKNFPLSSHYGNLINQLSRKSTLKIDHNMKRTTCKNCKITLTQKVNLVPKNRKIIILRLTCGFCKFKKRYVINKAKPPLWFERNESLIEILKVAT